MEPIHFESHFFPSLLPCNTTQKCSRENVPSNQSSRFVLLCYLMVGQSERLSTISWPRRVWGKSLLVSNHMPRICTHWCYSRLFACQIWGWKLYTKLGSFSWARGRFCAVSLSNGIWIYADILFSWLVDIASLWKVELCCFSTKISGSKLFV